MIHYYHWEIKLLVRSIEIWLLFFFFLQFIFDSWCVLVFFLGFVFMFSCLKYLSHFFEICNSDWVIAFCWNLINLLLSNIGNCDGMEQLLIRECIYHWAPLHSLIPKWANKLDGTNLCILCAQFLNVNES